MLKLVGRMKKVFNYKINLMVNNKSRGFYNMKLILRDTQHE